MKESGATNSELTQDISNPLYTIQSIQTMDSTQLETINESIPVQIKFEQNTSKSEVQCTESVSSLQENLSSSYQYQEMIVQPNPVTNTFDAWI